MTALSCGSERRHGTCSFRCGGRRRGCPRNRAFVVLGSLLSAIPSRSFFVDALHHSDVNASLPDRESLRPCRISAAEEPGAIRTCPSWRGSSAKNSAAGAIAHAGRPVLYGRWRRRAGKGVGVQLFLERRGEQSGAPSARARCLWASATRTLRLRTCPVIQYRSGGEREHRDAVLFMPDRMTTVSGRTNTKLT